MPGDDVVQRLGLRFSAVGTDVLPGFEDGLPKQPLGRSLWDED